MQPASWTLQASFIRWIDRTSSFPAFQEAGKRWEGAQQAQHAQPGANLYVSPATGVVRTRLGIKAIDLHMTFEVLGTQGIRQVDLERHQKFEVWLSAGGVHT